MLALGVLQVPVLALAPSDGGALTLLPVTINASAGDQYDPHVSGDLAAYTAGDKIRYYDFFTGNDAQVPAPLDAVDRLSDVSNGKIVYSREEVTGRSPIMVFDTAADLYVYEASSNRLFRVTSTPADESLNDVYVLPTARLGWSGPRAR